MRISLFIFVIFICFSSFAKKKGSKKIEKIMYLNKSYGHIYKNASYHSQSYSTVTCGHPIKVLSLNGRMKWGKDFFLVKAGPYEGYIRSDNLSEKEESCWQDIYPRFFNALNLSISDMYYWGKLSDQFDRGESQVR